MIVIVGEDTAGWLAKLVLHSEKESFPREWKLLLWKSSLPEPAEPAPKAVLQIEN